jgi:hypothetical protein
LASHCHAGKLTFTLITIQDDGSSCCNISAAKYFCETVGEQFAPEEQIPYAVYSCDKECLCQEIAHTFSQVIDFDYVTLEMKLIITL